MKLLICHIENFGRLSGLTIDFTDSVTVICRENGWGKSTLAAFLKAMFYGFDSKKERTAVAGERKLYQPWQGGTYGGDVVFETDGKRYKISRTFGKSERTDAFQLFDGETNLPDDTFSKNIGEELFGIDRASFQRSVFIAQSQVLAETTDAINAKLGNLAENTNDINNYETAAGRIKDEMNRLTPDRATGSIKKRTNEITALSEQLRALVAAGDAFLEKKKLLNDKENERKQLTERRYVLSAQLKEAGQAEKNETLQKQHDQLCYEEKQKKELYRKLRAQFPGGVPKQKDLSEMSELAGKLKEYETTEANFAFSAEQQDAYEDAGRKFGADEGSFVAKLDQMKEALSLVGKMSSDIAEMEKEQSPKGKHAASTRIGIALFLAGIVFFVLFIRLGQLLPFLAAGVISCAACICLLLSGIRSRKMEQKKWQEQKAQKKEEQQERQDEVLGFLSQYGKSADVSSASDALFELRSEYNDYIRAQEKAKQAESAKEKASEAEQKIRHFLQAFEIEPAPPFSSQIASLLVQTADLKSAYQMWKESKEKLDRFEEEHEKDKWDGPTEAVASVEQLNEQITALDKRLETLTDTIGTYKMQLEDLKKELDKREELEETLREKTACQEKEKKRYEILKLTQQYLQAAKEQFTARYMAPISNGFAKYYHFLTALDANGTDDNWMVDANMELKVKEHGQYRETGWLSAGRKDLIGFCMRLALVDAMYQEEKPFLLLDDPFVNLDAAKTAQGNRLIEMLGESYQVIYLTCHESRKP